MMIPFITEHPIVVAIFLSALISMLIYFVKVRLEGINETARKLEKLDNKLDQVFLEMTVNREQLKDYMRDHFVSKEVFQASLQRTVKSINGGLGKK